MFGTIDRHNKMTCRAQNSSLYLQGLGHCDISGASIGSTDILILMFYKELPFTLLSVSQFTRKSTGEFKRVHLN